jgi:hypothetical protein
LTCIVFQDLHFYFAMQSKPITTKVGSSNSVHGEVYSIQHYVIQFVSDLRQTITNTSSNELFKSTTLEKNTFHNHAQHTDLIINIMHGKI